MDISKHPILKQAYELTLAIEKCGASDDLTRAVILSSDLMEDVDKLVKENISLKERLTRCLLRNY